MPRHDFARNSPCFLETCIPELHDSLPLKPPKTYKQTVNDTCPIFTVTGCILGGLNHIVRDDTAIRTGECIVSDLAGNNLLNLIFQSQSYLGDLSRRTC